jgi:FkbM family methyltransferase
MLNAMVKRAARRAGFDVRRHNVSGSEEARFQATLSTHRINLIFDVGANEGQFARHLRESGYRGRIVSFEPIAAVWDKLKAASASDPLWEAAPRGAVGAEDGDIEFHISANSVSSSALNILDTTVKAAPGASYVGTECLPVRRLDSVGAEYVHPDSVLFIKIDTQGFEQQVLQGATEMLKKAAGLQLEVSLVQLYENQSLYDELIGSLKALGFELWDFLPVFVDPASGRLLQADATFFRA